MLWSRCLPVVLLAAFGCTSEDGQTPDCVTPEECNQPPTCAEAPEDPIQCCKDSEGNQFTGADLDLCLIGFGEPPVGGVGGSPGTGGTAGAATGGTAPGGMGGSGGT